MTRKTGKTKADAGMPCPACGTPMNRHAEKVREPRDPEELSKMDPVLGGVVEEFHTCPACGRNAARMLS